MNSSSKETVKLEFESRSHNEQFARVVTAVFAARLDPTVEEIEDIKTAVSEAVTNAVIHGYEKEEGIVRLFLNLPENGPAWDFPLWRLSWMRSMWNRNRGREPGCGW